MAATVEQAAVEEHGGGVGWHDVAAGVSLCCRSQRQPN
jgi:hypothetical protein